MTGKRLRNQRGDRSCLFVLLLLALQAKAAPDIAIEHVNVVDVRAATIYADQTVVVRGQRVGEVGKTAAPKGARRINGRGKYLIPGLWDMHVHLGMIGSGSFQIYLANGITGMREMESSLPEFDRLKQYRVDVASGKTVGPELVATTEAIESRGPGKPAPFGVQNAVEARSVVDLLREVGADFVTVGGDVPRQAYMSLADECRRLNFPFSGHVSRDLTPAEVSDAGQRSIEHMDGLLLACSSAESHLRDLMKQGQPVPIETVVETFDPGKASELAACFRKNGTWLCPTLTEQRFPAEADDPGLYRDPRLRYVRSNFVREWESRRQTARNSDLAKKLFETNLRLTGLMWRNGVRILAGTDTPWPYCIPGFALHDELELLVRAGLSPAAALAAATIGPAEFLGRTVSTGGIEPGAPANLLLLDGNPLADISNTNRISAVVIQGNVLTRRDLGRLLDRVAVAAKGQ
jgi:cytosine/adenosine deaminase-related metal-dependent hydrolase